jgi:hypothetical protein
MGPRPDPVNDPCAKYKNNASNYKSCQAVLANMDALDTGVSEHCSSPSGFFATYYCDYNYTPAAANALIALLAQEVTNMTATTAFIATITSFVPGFDVIDSMIAVVVFLAGTFLIDSFKNDVQKALNDSNQNGIYIHVSYSKQWVIFNTVDIAYDMFVRPCLIACGAR